MQEINVYLSKYILTSILQELAVTELNWNEILSLYLLTGVACLPLSVPSSSTDKYYRKKYSFVIWKFFKRNYNLDDNKQNI